LTAAAQKASPPPAGDNKPPSDEAIIAVNLSRIRTAQDRYASEGGSLRSAFAKAEQQGVNLAAAKRAIKIVKSGKVDDWLEETSAITSYLRIMRHGINDGQLNLDLESKLAPIDEKAKLDGLAAGRGGESESNNPHHGNTKAGMAWLEGYRQGRAERELVLSMKDDPPADNDNGHDGLEDDED
jgi:ribosome modulation factor